MKDHRIRFGCQTYTWQMSIEKYRGKMEHIVSTVKASGMEGLEPELCMLGDLASDPPRFKDCLQSHGIELGALCLVCDWLGSKETPEEATSAYAAISMLKTHFPKAVLALCQMPGRNRDDLSMRQRNALSCVNAIGRRAAAGGISAAFHPNSPAGSVFRVEEDYNILLDGLDASVVGFAPDAGHIAKGGIDPAKLIRKHSGIVRHVHFKDMDSFGRWVEMGRGIIDFHGIVDALEDAGYNGWIMVEDESALAENDPDDATMANGRYIISNFK
jgi:inosose dehydratase